MAVYAGQGDAHRSMALLWRGAVDGRDDGRRAPGPRPALSVDEIVDAAIAVADAEGMSALSMRAVGERLGRTAMALYTYVPGKDELIDLMYDRVLAELASDHARGSDWRAAVTSWARDTRDCYLRHPWMLQVSQARPVLGPNEFASVESLAVVLRRTGLPPRVLRAVVGALSHFVRGAARTTAEARQAATATGVSDLDWWAGRAPKLGEFAPDFAERFPTMIWLESDSAPAPADEDTPYLEQEAERNFVSGLTLLLDGVEAAVHGQESAASSADPD